MSKNKNKPSVVFLGSGPVAAKSLAMIQEHCDVEAVITKPTTKREMSSSATSTPVFTVTSKDELDTLIEHQKFSSNLGVIIDFGIIVSKKTIDSFAKGIVNSHFSLLPELRGADPISFAILQGRVRTGVSLMMLVEAMDEGPLLAQAEIQIDPDDTTPSLTEKLIELSDKMLESILPLWIKDEIAPAEQNLVTIANSPKPSYTRKLTKSDGILDWSKSANRLKDEVRAYADWPKSQASFGTIDCIITQAAVIHNDGHAHGKLFTHNKELAVACGKDAIVIKKLKPAGKKEMDSISFIAGYGSRLGL